MSPFELSVERAGDHVFVGVKGELDLAVASKLESCLIDLDPAPGTTLVVDLSELEFLDSSGLRVLVLTHHRSEQEGFRFVVIRGPDQVARIFELTRMDEQLEVLPSRDALAALEG